VSGAWGDMGNLLKQAQKMQRELDHAREEIKNSRVEASAGDGAVQVEFSGDGQVQSVRVRPELLRAGDADHVQDLLLKALQAGYAKAATLREERLQRVTGGLNLPGIF